ncbi:7-cyano-7-deazaguanine reductase : 7-carboxy-7-deazaguanine synthase OS=Chromobacterium violaceum (strain ATCC 12472 / DSM 30191 / JCM 1249 / NBRC 12614 / NCIMB 9131 / NCTC 9757) GN=queE PE=3 SV=1 [Tuwongella immobilis]|uniref:7-cyano-7-deazaguanine reductase: 7-carboxy-7-deazaguanine synthase n=1 Tax=Tuwongella immobilis TaxID=692036 RepID=A0A6C2YWU4_9BACT|nr:7-cyano-7-deazaguanine reductase : 7-carboxy-7-deazaguanine synthase OS=Chromobacterium violaceum (strain ATCC 12472 / DSM 30191 / JCM 1249 / NBRC 12614 / NCIMB 9131 / NCTC 9757) GN=queE PE=3 SV=1 [Tuwongella immobilis]VTS08000.1 7-cyano-7-deazaguanine reductase : 7-carboxy-7-deazaguanine synthase OS=Chromobacterium violaceum (strain ATCC 12472 / DSM 30191 / JCM 1249 / NBRC 12614 / NCIMB 9131 / NCTC 9757) GN=queE PE=3 SV=1 [Tuwongella immobilis]
MSGSDSHSDWTTFWGHVIRFFYLQPMDGRSIVTNTRAAVEYCLAHPQWRLSIQTHKVLEVRSANFEFRTLS